jgi:diazepam-binding inhibitor (GABA receptor modulating acyl-CoA-binding protein)
MATKTEFEQAAADVAKLTKRPENEELLTLYALFKQATDGDVTGSRPGMLDIKGRKKFDAWAGKKGLSAEAARTQYVVLVNQLRAKYA